MTAIRAVAYYRKSNEDDGGSVEQQQQWARPACEKEGVELVREFTDQAKRGWDTAARTDFHEMLRFCQQEAARGAPVQAVVCWHTNRFSRADSQETSWFIWEFRKAGVARVLTAQRWYDFSRMEDRLLHNIEQEAGNHKGMIDTAEAALRGQLANAAAGRPNGGPPPYGYRTERCLVVVKGKKRWRPVRLVLGPDAEQKAVKFIFRTYADTDAGLRWIAVRLTEMKVPSPTGGSLWCVNTVRKILRSPVYLGRLVWNRTSKGKFFGVVDCKVERRKGGRRHDVNGEAEWIGNDGTHDPIIDLETFERCQAKFAGRQGGKRPGPAPFLLSGLLRCGQCGRPMVGRTQRTKRAGREWVYRYYTCTGYNHLGKAACNHNSINADDLARAVLTRLQRDWLTESNVEVFLEEARRQDREGRDDARAAVLRGRKADLELKVKRAAERVLDEEDESLLPALRDALKQRQDDLEAVSRELATLDRQETVDDPEEAAQAALEVVRRLNDAIEADDRAELRAILRETVGRIELVFNHHVVGSRTRSTFARGLVYLRDDLRIKYTSAHTASMP
jgi:site-specific DNA recombinase